MATPEGNVIKKRPHTYSPSELAAISDGIADTLDAGDALAREKDIFNKDVKRREKELDDKLQTLRNNKKQGYEIREYECSVIRVPDTKTVQFIDVISGEIIATAPMTNEDWEVVFKGSQRGLFDVERPDENVLRAEADAAHGPAIFPDYDPENGHVIAGPATDAYNRRYPNSPYKHLTEAEFAPALPSTVVADFIATLSEEAQAKFHEIIASFAHYTVAELETCVAAYQSPPVPLAEGSDEQKVQNIILDYLNTRILALLHKENSEPAADLPTDNGVQSEKPVLYPNHDEMGDIIPGPETDLYNEAVTVAQETDEQIQARLDSMSQDEIKAKLAQYDQYDQALSPMTAISFYAAALRGAVSTNDNHAADDGPEARDDDSEPQGDDSKPKKPKTTPKRPANRKK